MQATYLDLKWTVSRGRDTYGYNIATLTDRNTSKRYRTCGGGYDMTGTVFGQWLTETHQERLLKLKPESVPYTGSRTQHPTLYGLFFKTDTGAAYCDGGCGIESMLRIAETIGLSVEKTHTKRGRCDGFFAHWEG